MPINTLIIAKPKGFRCKEFGREAHKFADHWRGKGHNVVLVELPNLPQWKLRARVLKAIREHGGPIDRLVFFCHGTWKWLKVGFHIWNVDRLAQEISNVAASKLDVALYACSCGRAKYEKGWPWPWRMKAMSYTQHAVKGAEGFGVRLEDALLHQGVDARVFCHASYGHTTRNPYCYRITKGAFDKTIYREPIVDRGTPGWKAWIKDLKTSRRFEVPFE